jgi:hypothetical protein
LRVTVVTRRYATKAGLVQNLHSTNLLAPTAANFHRKFAYCASKSAPNQITPDDRRRAGKSVGEAKLLHENAFAIL